ncbi:Response regulator receiver modulated metal dependent phosphohydrolase [Candidatus Terasakiella magnetica]|nr:Response regulator receiver modulated metal dependent phosphohydrolase [Candidatus Terasakiella magnetica]
MTHETRLATILVVDDAPDNITVIGNLLKGRYSVKAAKGGAAALLLIESGVLPDLVLLDVMMPDMDGYEVCRRLKADPATAHIPVIFLTAKAEEEDERYGLEIGGADYVTKPISPPVLELRIANQLALQEGRRALEGRNAHLETEVRRRVNELAEVQDATIRAMAALTETRDNDTGNHIRRTQIYVRLLAERLRDNGCYSALLNDEYIDLLYKSAPLHDIGKVGIPDSVLLKPGRLTPEEFEIIKTHAALGGDTLAGIERSLSTPSSFLRLAREIAMSHHEKWDGSGYPQGLRGEDIPLSARIMAIADVFDALTCKRPYKEPFSHDAAVEMIRSGSGTHFAPVIVEAFLQIEGEFAEIARKFHDHI